MKKAAARPPRPRAIAEAIHPFGLIWAGTMAVLELLASLGLRRFARSVRYRVSICVMTIVVGMAALIIGALFGSVELAAIGLATVTLGHCSRATAEAWRMIRRLIRVFRHLSERRHGRRD
jgi:hypothetical protein